MCKNYEQISHDFDCQIIGWKQLKIWSCHIALLVEIWNSAWSSDFSPSAPNDQIGEEHQKLINQFQWSFVFHLFCGVFLHWRIGSCLPWLWKLTSSRDEDGVSGVENDVFPGEQTLVKKWGEGLEAISFMIWKLQSSGDEDHVSLVKRLPWKCIEGLEVIFPKITLEMKMVLHWKKDSDKKLHWRIGS